MLMQGTANRTPAELEEAIGLLGSAITVGADQDGLSVGVTSLARNLEPTLDLVEEILLEPRWDEQEFDRLKREAMVAIVQSRGDPSSLAATALSRALYGPTHPYGIPARGTEASVADISLDDLKAWYAEQVHPDRARLQIAGAVSMQQAQAALAELAEAWPNAGLGPLPSRALGAQPAGGQVYFIDVPDAKQSVIRAGRRTLMADAPDWVRANYANQRLGGGSSGRLTQLLRIEKGYTYGAYSGLGDNTHDISPFLVVTSVRSNVTGESLALVREQLDQYAETFTDEDAEITRNQVIKRNARAFETLGAKLGLLDRIARFGLPLDVVERDQALLLAMETEDFRRVIRDHLGEEALVWVVVGDGATQRQAVADFAEGPVVELDRDFRPVGSQEN